MDFLKALISNFPLVCAISGWLIAQFLKVFTGIFKVRRFSIGALLGGSGGMPSSHSSAVCALAGACALRDGWDSTTFGIAMLFAVIVMVDATGVRREAGRQAAVLNRIMTDLFTSSDYDDLDRNLKELIGHTPFQVVVGAIVGSAIPFMMSLIPLYYQQCWG